MRILGLTGLLFAGLLVAACTAPSTVDTQSDSLPKLRAAISGLEVQPEAKPGPACDAGWQHISKCESPEELREIARHFGDSRPTVLLESLENPDGGPVNYTIGDALFFAFKGRFFRKWQYMLPGRNCPEYFENEATFKAWLEEHNYDIAQLRKAYERDTPRDS